MSRHAVEKLDAEGLIRSICNKNSYSANILGADVEIIVKRSPSYAYRYAFETLEEEFVDWLHNRSMLRTFVFIRLRSSRDYLPHSETDLIQIDPQTKTIELIGIGHTIFGEYAEGKRVYLPVKTANLTTFVENLSDEFKAIIVGRMLDRMMAETIIYSSQVKVIDGEAHWLVEGSSMPFMKLFKGGKINKRAYDSFCKDAVNQFRTTTQEVLKWDGMLSK